MKLLLKNQKRIGTSKKHKDIKHRRMNKLILNMEAKNAELKKAVSLLNSMVLSGEKHSDASQKIVKQALKENLNDKEKEENHEERIQGNPVK